MTSAAKQAIADAGLTVEDMQCIIPHQANIRIIKAIRDRVGGKDDQYFINVDRYGNMSAGSIAVAFCEAVEIGRIKRGDNVLLVVFGAYFTWGSVYWSIDYGIRKTGCVFATRRVIRGYGQRSA